MRELSVLEAAEECPVHDCLVYEDRVWSYAEVAERVHSAVAWLEGQGVTAGVRVALTPQVDLDSVIWLYALFELGCPAVLLHPRLTDRERAALIRETRPAHMIAERTSATAGSSAGGSDGHVPGDRCLAVVYTSGTRGRPRGAILSRRAFVASYAAHTANLGWRPEDRWLLAMPPAHVGGLSILTRSLIARRCVVLSPGPFDASRVIDAMERHRVSLLSVVPTMLRRLLACEQPRWAPGADLRAVLVGGAAFPAPLREESTVRGIPVLATYGCTEACSQVATQRPEQSGDAGCGRPLYCVRVRVENGEIQIAGDTLMDGYVDEDPADAPWASDGWLRTGDFGSLSPDGQLHVSGRIDDLIVTGGENVAPQEVEACLESVPGVASACVFAMPHDEWGEEVVAVLVPEPAGWSHAALRDQLSRELAPYKRPKRICTAESLPVNRSGKVDRAEAKARYADLLRPI